jgi:hypothetical protein
VIGAYRVKASTWEAPADTGGSDDHNQGDGQQQRTVPHLPGLPSRARRGLHLHRSCAPVPARALPDLWRHRAIGDATGGCARGVPDETVIGSQSRSLSGTPHCL